MQLLSGKVFLLGHFTAPSPTISRSKHTALYLRVSTPNQKPDLQFDGLRSYAERAGLEIVEEYLDVVASGRKEGRPGLEAGMAAAKARGKHVGRPRQY